MEEACFVVCAANGEVRLELGEVALRARYRDRGVVAILVEVGNDLAAHPLRGLREAVDRRIERRCGRHNTVRHVIVVGDDGVVLYRSIASGQAIADRRRHSNREAVPQRRIPVDPQHRPASENPATADWRVGRDHHIDPPLGQTIIGPYAGAQVRNLEDGAHARIRPIAPRAQVRLEAQLGDFRDGVERRVIHTPAATHEYVVAIATEVRAGAQADLPMS